MELHAQAAERTLRAVVAPEAPLRAALLRRGAAGRCGSPGEAARPWRRLHPLERGCGGAEARAAPAWALHPGAAVQRPRRGGKGDWCADGGQRRRFPPTHCPPPLLKHHWLPSPPRLPTLPLDPPQPFVGVQDGLWLPLRLISAQCCGRWRTRCSHWQMELQLGRRYYQLKGIEACLHNTYS